MLKNRKKIIFALVFVIISVVFFMQAFENNVSNNLAKSVASDLSSSKNFIQDEAGAGEIKTEHVKNIEKSTDSSIFATSSQIVNKSQNAEIIILDKKIEFSFEEGDSLFNAMNELQNSGQISFKGKEFSAMGFFVEEINGFKQLPKERKYWRYYVNNKEASVGISNYKLKNNDSIEWKLVAYK
jgi:hypothetical protein